MAENEDRLAFVPWLPLITLIMIGGGLFLSSQQLISSRPPGGNTRLAVDRFEDQNIDARLWEDPLGVAFADWEKTQRNNDAHSITEFQTLLQETRPPSKQLQVLAIMIPGGPYVEDVERRLRSRRAVIEGLHTVGYAPEKDHEIGYFWIPWQDLNPDMVGCVSTLEKNRDEDQAHFVWPSWLPRNLVFPWSPTNQGIQRVRCYRQRSHETSLVVPYEWYQDGESNEILVVWLIDDAFGDAPLARLADFISWFRFDFSSVLVPFHLLPPPVFKILGPENSGTLYRMVIEANHPLWNDDTRQCLASTHIYSSQAAVAEDQLLSGLPDLNRPPTAKSLIEQAIKGVSFERINLPDDKIVDTMLQELKHRGVSTKDHVVIISEEDTYYARALCSSFRNKAAGKKANLATVSFYTYLRGFDGKLPLDKKDENETKDAALGNDKNTESNQRTKEQMEGVSQADYIRRLAEMLKALKTEQAVKAVGLLGSDVYDKLELLKALRPMLPEALFFTNNLDIRFGHPEEWNETHNLVVVSAFDLSLGAPLNNARFRDSYQTALFAATREAIEQKNQNTPECALVFEVGRNGLKNLSREPGAAAKRFNEVLFNVLGMIACVIGLFVWASVVSSTANNEN